MLDFISPKQQGTLLRWSQSLLRYANKVKEQKKKKKAPASQFPP